MLPEAHRYSFVEPDDLLGAPPRRACSRSAAGSLRSGLVIALGAWVCNRTPGGAGSVAPPGPERPRRVLQACAFDRLSCTTRIRSASRWWSVAELTQASGIVLRRAPLRNFDLTPGPAAFGGPRTGPPSRCDCTRNHSTRDTLCPILLYRLATELATDVPRISPRARDSLVFTPRSPDFDCSPAQLRLVMTEVLEANRNGRAR